MNREVYKNRLLKEMYKHIGEEKAVDMGVLHGRIFGKDWENKINDTRPTRKLVDELQWEGVSIYSSSDGYYMRGTESELDEYLSRYRRRALRILAKEAAMRKMTVPALLSQMQLNLVGDQGGRDETA